MNQEALETTITRVHSKLINPATSKDELRALGLRLAELVALRSASAVARMEREKGIFAYSEVSKAA